MYAPRFRGYAFEHPHNSIHIMHKHIHMDIHMDTYQMALARRDFVMGFICTNKLSDDAGMIHMTPGLFPPTRYTHLPSVCVCVCVFVCVWGYVHECVSVCVLTYVCMHVCMDACCYSLSFPARLALCHIQDTSHNLTHHDTCQHTTCLPAYISG